MAKIIITENQFNRLKSRLVETIDPSEAYREWDSIQTVINGKRGVCFLVVWNDGTRGYLRQALAAGCKTISMEQSESKRGVPYHGIANIIYRKGYEAQAKELAAIARKHGGYLPTETPEETFRIGILLDYDPDKVAEFVLNKWPNFNVNKYYGKKD